MLHKWIGRFHVYPEPDTDTLGSDQLRAFVYILGLAESHDNFIEEVELALCDFDLYVLDFVEVELLSTRMIRAPICDELAELAEKLRGTRPSVRFDTFVTYPLDNLE